MTPRIEHWPWDHAKINGVWHRRARLKKNAKWQRLEVVRIDLPPQKWKQSKNRQMSEYNNEWIWKNV